MTQKQTIVLVGLMGAGKTTIGSRLAKKLELPFKDSDREIEKHCHLSISDIFDIQGEEYFRKVERTIIAQLLEGPPMVLATGGGAFMQKAIREAIRRHGISVWLRAEHEVLLERVSRRDNRPILERGDKGEILHKLMDERGHVYAEADITIDSSDGPHAAVVKRIITALEAYEGLSG